MLKIALCQINPTVGFLKDNIQKIKNFVDEHISHQANLYVFPEFSVTGYPLSDLCLHKTFLDDIEDSMNILKKYSLDQKVALLVGAPWRIEGKLYNAALYITEGKIENIICKQSLPNYGVFDEKRYFSNDKKENVIKINDIKLGILICEDIWEEEPIKEAVLQEAEAIICINGSPYELNKLHKRITIIQEKFKKHSLPIMYLNLVGGQDDLLFDGRSFVVNQSDSSPKLMKGFTEDCGLVKIKNKVLETNFKKTYSSQIEDKTGNLYQALVLSLKDYVQKNRFKGVLLGISGGVDSAISASIAVDALGAQSVLGLMMPFLYTSDESLQDAKNLVENLKFKYNILPINSIYETYTSSIEALIDKSSPGLMEENLQARIRGTLLMSLSNKLGYMVLSTGNKSEMSVGYATLYGDMCGGFNVLKDVYKTQVFDICRWRNNNWESNFLGPKGYVIPENIINKAPSAELREDQKDSDSLPEYDLLDQYLQLFIEEDKSPQNITEEFPENLDMTKKVFDLFTRSEYKRRQSPPGPKVTPKALANDRRYPITNAYREKD